MSSSTEQLKDLAGLYKEGLLTREEFDEQKARVLAESRATPSSPGVSVPAAPERPTSEPTTAEVATAQAPQSDAILGYELKHQIGEGGMGKVFLATHGTLDQHVAIKILDPALARLEEVRTRFIREANIQVKLRHPNIVQVLNIDAQGPHLALIMEYIDGSTLEDMLQERGALPLDFSVAWMAQILHAVGHAHAQGIVHRDLKPSNILIQRDGYAKVTDFGIAKVFGDAKLTRTGTLMGTAHYMSPEQVLGRSDIDHRTDIYSLGSTFFEMLLGRPPFFETGGGNTDSEFLVRQAHIQASPPDPRTLDPRIPLAVANAMLRALAKAPADRFQTCGEFAAALVQSTPPPDPASLVASDVTASLTPIEQCESDSEESDWFLGGDLAEEVGISTAFDAAPVPEHPSPLSSGVLPPARGTDSRIDGERFGTFLAYATRSLRDDGFWFAPEIPEDIGRRALVAIGIPEDENLVALFDDSIGGFIRNTLLVGERGIYGKTAPPGSPAGAFCVPYPEFLSHPVETIGDCVTIGKDIRFDAANLVFEIRDLLRVLQARLSGRAARR